MSTSRHRHVRDIDALRGIAIAGVTTTHVASALGLMGIFLPFCPLDITQLLVTGGLGVSLFFLLSGYLLTAGEDRRAATGVYSVRAYALRRFFRLIPAYYLSLAVYLLVLTRIGQYQPHVAVAWDLLLHLVLLHGWALPTVSTITAQYWSLTCEVSYYALLPLLVLQLRRFRLRVALYGISLLLSAVLYLWYATTSDVGLQFYILFNPATHLHLFLAGSLLATVEGREELRMRLARLPVGVPDAMFLGSLTLILLNAYLHPMEPASILVSRLGTQCMVSVCFSAYLLRSPILLRLLSCPGLAVLGRISFSLFLFHNLFLVELQHAGFIAALRDRQAQTPHLVLFAVLFLASTLPAIMLSACTYVWVELPGMHGFRSFGLLRRSRRPVAEVPSGH